MKRLLAVLSALTALSSAGIAFANDEVTFLPAGPSALAAGEYRSSEYGYALSFTPGWSLAKRDTPPARQQDRFNNEKQFSGNTLWAEVIPLHVGASLQDKTAIESAIYRGEDRSSVVSDTLVRHRGDRARAIEATAFAGNDPVFLYALAVTSHTHRSILLLVIKVPQQLKNEPDMQMLVQRMLDSFAPT
jgi:hypothetical protein